MSSSLLEEHYGYVADKRRIELYKLAVAKVLRNGQSVIHLGCGSGILGLLCLDAGAGRVTFIDDSVMLEVARQSMLRAGAADRCTFIRGVSFRH